MATRVKKDISKTTKEINNELVNDNNSEKENRIIAPDGVAAPIYRRLVAYIIDIILSLGSSFLFLITANSEEFAGSGLRWLYLASIVLAQVWFFGILPTDTMLGQTPGRKLMRIFVRRVVDKEPLNMSRSLLKEYVYGVFGCLFTIPFEIISLVLQLKNKKPEKSTNLQALPVEGKYLILPRDTIFKTEEVYLPKEK